MPQSLNARVQTLQHMGRQEHFDSEGGGRITRVIYCEPYTAHKRVVTALKGTIYSSNPPIYQRAKPHADPLYPWFYCADVQVEPAFPGAVRASRPMRFDPARNGVHLQQFSAIQDALNVLEDLDAADLIDNLDPVWIAGGAQDDVNQGDTLTVNTGEVMPISTYVSRGACGAKITATYLPLIFQPGAGADFDYVDPQWQPLTFTTQTGRNLFIRAAGTLGGVVNYGGLSDTFALPEVVWRFSIRRLMVPFLPAVTIAALANKVNGWPFPLGNIEFPIDTVRMEAPEVIAKRAPDGQLYYDILLKFLVRRLWEEYFDEVAGYTAGWVGWNWAFGIPTGRGVLAGIPAPFRRCCYYPVSWNTGMFGLGDARPLFLADTDLPPGTLPPGVGTRIHQAIFQCGFSPGQ